MVKQLYKSITVSLSGANDQGDTDSQFMEANVGIARVLRVALHRTAKSGTAYTADSLEIEIFQKENVDATDPAVDGPDSFYNRTGIEPAAVASGGLGFDDSDFAEPIQIANQTATQEGKISVRLNRTGGAADSRETYSCQIWGESD